MITQKQMALGAFLYPTGHHAAAWRHPGAQADAGVNFKHYAHIAQAAEAAKFDMLFLADSAGARGEDWGSLARFSTHYVAQFEPLTLLGALAAVTERIGLVATASTTFNEPYILQLGLRVAGARGHWQVVGSPEQVADVMEERFLNEGADGFNVMPPYLPGGLDDFIELVLPELRRRGLFRTDYEGRTLREHLGLKRPARRHTHNKAIDSSTPHAASAASPAAA